MRDLEGCAPGNPDSPRPDLVGTTWRIARLMAPAGASQYRRVWLTANPSYSLQDSGGDSAFGSRFFPFDFSRVMRASRRAARA